MAISKPIRRGGGREQGASQFLGKQLNLRNGSRFNSPEEDVLMTVTSTYVSKLNLQPMSDLDLMIANGYGSIAQNRLPSDWRTRKRVENPKKV